MGGWKWLERSKPVSLPSVRSVLARPSGRRCSRRATSRADDDAHLQELSFARALTAWHARGGAVLRSLGRIVVARPPARRGVAADPAARCVSKAHCGHQSELSQPW
jgi:hypothetical protein